jgi:DNA-nicking Smr family endonuclease
VTKRRPDEPRRFVVEVSGDTVAGRPEDVSRALLAKLRAGDAEPDREVDLHGLVARDARRHLASALREARAAGERCVLVVHGRGLHSESRAVLRDALPAWLQEPPHADFVLAFASAPRALGGPGATLVWLRRMRERVVSSAAPRSGEQDET